MSVSSTNMYKLRENFKELTQKRGIRGLCVGQNVWDRMRKPFSSRSTLLSELDLSELNLRVIYRFDSFAFCSPSRGDKLTVGNQALI